MLVRVLSGPLVHDSVTNLLRTLGFLGLDSGGLWWVAVDPCRPLQAPASLLPLAEPLYPFRPWYVAPLNKPSAPVTLGTFLGLSLLPLTASDPTCRLASVPPPCLDLLLQLRSLSLSKPVS